MIRIFHLDRAKSKDVTYIMILSPTSKNFQQKNGQLWAGKEKMDRENAVFIRISTVLVK